jgi:hypothetical protein
VGSIFLAATNWSALSSMCIKLESMLVNKGVLAVCKEIDMKKAPKKN